MMTIFAVEMQNTTGKHLPTSDNQAHNMLCMIPRDNTVEYYLSISVTGKF